MRPSFSGESPPSFPKVSSGVRGWGINSTNTNLSHRTSGNSIDRKWQNEKGYDLLSMRQGELFSHFLFTDNTVLVIYQSLQKELTVDWIINREVCRSPVLEEGVVTFEEQEGRIYFCHEHPELGKDEREPGVLCLRFDCTNSLPIFAFSDSSFRFIEVEPNHIKVVDSSGCFVLQPEIIEFDRKTDFLPDMKLRVDKVR